MEFNYNSQYLGHYVASDLKDQADVERERRALTVRSNILARRFAKSSGLDKHTYAF